MFLSKYCLIVLFYYYGFAKAENSVCEEKLCIYTCYGDPKDLIVPFYNETENSTYYIDLKQDERFEIIPNKSSSCQNLYQSYDWYILEVML